MPSDRFDKSIEPIDPASVRSVRLASGADMPIAAFGTFHSDWAQDLMHDATLEAIRLGWRHIDTARAYENESIVGEAIREAIKLGYIASPDDLFITGKLWNGHMDPEDVGTAIELANNSPMGLNFSVWTRDSKRGVEIASRLEAGTVGVNDGYAATWSSYDAPMGGMKASGVSRRHGAVGLLKFTETQTVAVQKWVPAFAPPPGLNYDQYNKLLTPLLKILKRTPFYK